MDIEDPASTPQKPFLTAHPGEEFFRSLFENAAAAMAVATIDGTLLQVNPAFCTLLGYSQEELLRLPVTEITHPDDRERTRENFRAVAAGESSVFHYEKRYLRRDGGAVWGLTTVAWLRDEAGRPTWCVALIQDITDHKRAEEALEKSERRFRSVFQHAGIGMNIITPEGRFLEVNPAFCAFLGYSEAELRELDVEAVTDPHDLEETRELFRRAAAGEVSRLDYEKRFRRRDGVEAWGKVSAVWIAGSDGRPAYGVGLVQDITPRKLAEAQLAESRKDLDYLAYHDPLTGLPNRLLLQDRLQHALARARRSGGETALLFVDLDRFKLINDSFGHEVGDRILREVAGRLRGIIRETDTLARFGGDEFIVLLEELPEPKTAVLVARKIIDTLATPIDLEQGRFHLGGSIGISLFPHNGEDAEALLKCGEVAMYQAKEKGRNTYQFYTPDMNARTRELLRLETSLRQALGREQFVLHYQPQFDLAAGRLTGVEALVRWNHPELGMVPPAEFIPMAEETGLIVALGEWILRAACAQARAWQDAGFPPLRMAVNISPRQFRHPRLAERIRSILAETALDAGLLELELTESMIMHDVEAAIRTMHELTALGIQLVIDDFGTGYSSLHYLRSFPIRKLKIDREFVRDVTTNANDAAIASAVIALARTMSLEVVAEGIETREQLAFLREKECQGGQGFLFSRPLPAAELGDILREGRLALG